MLTCKYCTYYTLCLENNEIIKTKVKVNCLSFECLPGYLPNWPGGSSAKFDYSFHTIKPFVLMRDEYQCQVCHKKEKIEVHHLKPQNSKGSNHPRNLMVLCQNCHDGIHTKLIKRFQTAKENRIIQAREKKANIQQWNKFIGKSQ